MEHVVREPTPPFSSGDGRIEVHQLPSAEDNLIWLIVDSETGEVAAVDGPEAGTVLSYCEAKGLKLSAIINTHTHMDHVGINHDLQARGMLDGLRVFGSKKKAGDIPGLTDPLDDGDQVKLGGAVADVLLTEGHIDGHLSYVFGDVLFCGDTLFGAGCGYLFDGPPRKMHESLSRLMELDPATRVCCAHEYTQDNLRFAFSVEPDNPALRERIVRDWATRARGGCTIPTTIGSERDTNPFVRHASSALVENVRAAWPDRALDAPDAIFAATRALKDRKDYKSITDAMLGSLRPG